MHIATRQDRSAPRLEDPASGRVENAPKHSDSVQFCELAALGDALEQLAADGEFEGEVVLCSGFEPFVEFDLVGSTRTSVSVKRRIEG